MSEAKMCNVVVTIEHRYLSTPDGAVWSTFFGYDFWRRYLEEFSTVTVVARVKRVDKIQSHFVRADGPRVAFHPVPHYHGPREFLAKFLSVRRAIRSAITKDAAVILRVDSQIASFVDRYLTKAGRPYAVEVVVDPLDVFAPGARREWLSPIWRLWFYFLLRRQCKGASAASYVTERALQKRYPSPRARFETHFSSVQLPPEAFAPHSRRFNEAARNIICVATMDDHRKGHIVLLSAIAKCRARGLNLHAVLIGDGGLRPSLEKRAESLNLRERISFVGQLPAGSAVRRYLDDADIFVLPSTAEGLPRAAIEAMARGLPVIGTQLGGFAELLPQEVLVPKGNADALATCLADLATSPDRLTSYSTRNINKAVEYSEKILAGRRKSFYRAVVTQHQEWVANEA